MYAYEEKILGWSQSTTTYTSKSAQVLLFLVYMYQLNKDVQNPVLLKSQEKLEHCCYFGCYCCGLSHVLYVVNYILNIGIVLGLFNIVYNNVEIPGSKTDVETVQEYL